MAGYDRKAHAKTYLLKFEAPDLAGLEVLVRTTSMSGVMDMAGLADLGSGDITPEQIKQLDPLFDRFVESLDSWNLEDDGQPVPMTKAALLDQDLEFVLSLVGAWAEAIVGVPGPLGATSNAGAQSVAGSIPMETLSESRAS
jgi:hypothetical protein